MLRINVVSALRVLRFAGPIFLRQVHSLIGSRTGPPQSMIRLEELLPDQRHTAAATGDVQLMQETGRDPSPPGGYPFVFFLRSCSFCVDRNTSVLRVLSVEAVYSAFNYRRDVKVVFSFQKAFEV